MLFADFIIRAGSENRLGKESSALGLAKFPYRFLENEFLESPIESLAFLMNTMENTPIENLPVIEVPPELRGLSDEEILALHPVDPEKRDRFRLSKKERAAKKLAREQAKFRRLMEQYENRDRIVHSSRPMPKMSDFDGNAATQAARRSTVTPAPRKTLFVPSQMKKTVTAQAPIAVPAKSVPAPLPPRQSSGRVLVGSFGGAKFGAAKTQIISEDELAKKRAAEEAKRKRELAKKRTAMERAALERTVLTAPEVPQKLDPNSLFKPDSPLGTAQTPEIPGVPVKRKRGRPRKNPLPE